ncbi:MAG TPA: glycosyltransferase family 4 protein, partial [Longimicrobium sp.]|nr:glycosyltransferase family 4 protein [Longimicrobium sp.]
AYPQRMAGANQSLFHLVTHLPPEVEPRVVATAPGPVVDAYRRAGVECTVLQVPPSLDRYGREVLATGWWARAGLVRRDVLPYLARVRRLLSAWGADLLHPNDARAALLSAPAARSLGIPVVSHLRGELRVGRAARTAFELLSSRIVAVSDGARHTLSALGRARAATVYNGIGEVVPPPARFPWLDGLRARGVRVVCCFASVVPFKGHHHLVRAAAELDRRGWGDRVAFVCVGDLPGEYAWYHEGLRELMQSLRVRNVTFTGWSDVPFAFYRHADLSVLPSVSHETLRLGGREFAVWGNEGFPRTHLEAMRFGLPVVGTRIAGVPEQVEDGVTGLLVEPSDPAGLADALERLLASPELAARMGAAGRERVERLFSTRAYVEGVLRVYAGALRGSGRVPGVKGA